MDRNRWDEFDDVEIEVLARGIRSLTPHEEPQRQSHLELWDEVHRELHARRRRTATALVQL
jgi:hypothetical protein